jgi:hypothetical protein
VSRKLGRKDSNLRMADPKFSQTVDPPVSGRLRRARSSSAVSHDVAGCTSLYLAQRVRSWVTCELAAATGSCLNLKPETLVSHGP